MIKNRVVVKERDAWSDLANFIGEMVAKYAEEIDLDNLPDPDIYLRGKWMKQLYREFYKEKNITKFRNAKNSVDRKRLIERMWRDTISEKTEHINTIFS